MADIAQFQQFMDQGHDAAWQRDWETAMNAYSKAVQVKPEDPEAHISLGLALLNLGKLNQALKVYKRAAQLAADDPIPLERSADVLERMGRLKEAAQQYVKVSDIYLAQRDLDKAIGNWERATQLTPGLMNVHLRLAQAYDRIGDKNKAIREYLTLAFNFRRKNDIPKAIRAVERALRIDKNNAQALNTLRALKSGGEVSMPEDAPKRQEAPKEPQDVDPFGMPLSQAEAEVGEANSLGPIGEALDEALTLLAAQVVEGGLNQSVMYAMQGMEAQRQNLHPQAISAYQQAVDAGLNYPSLAMVLGGLLVLENNPQDALSHLSNAVLDSTLSAGAMHGLGLAYFHMGDQKQATRSLIQSLREVDTSLTMDSNEVDELTQVYDNILTTLNGRTTDSLRAINERFISLLSGEDWKQRIADTRRHLDETMRDEGGQGVVDFLVARGSDDLAEIVSSIDRYIRQGFYTLAMEESHRAVEKSPYYLPVHVRMAEVMMKEGRIRQAINKYNMVAKSYLVREERDRAASILGEVLEMAPLDVDIRISLIELLEDEERWLEALDEYIALAETFQQLGDFEQANDAFLAAEELARRITAPAEKLTRIKHALADIHQMRLNTRQAQKMYEEILQLNTRDEKALRSLIDIYFTQGNSVEAVKKVDMLLSVYARERDVRRITQLLEELVHSNPSDTGLRKRLASIYVKRGQRREAIEQLDAMGELQLDAGLTREAAKTIRQIIALNPDRVDDYKKLLAQLGG